MCLVCTQMSVISYCYLCEKQLKTEILSQTRPCPTRGEAGGRGPSPAQNPRQMGLHILQHPLGTFLDLQPLGHRQGLHAGRHFLRYRYNVLCFLGRPHRRGELSARVPIVSKIPKTHKIRCRASETNSPRPPRLSVPPQRAPSLRSREMHPRRGLRERPACASPPSPSRRRYLADKRISPRDAVHM